MNATRARRWAIAVLALASLVAPVRESLAADDGGVGAFFRQLGFGADPEPATAPVYGQPDERPITVRPRRKTAVVRRPTVKIAVGPVAPVSIFNDHTLKAGDAVMTKSGVRVFLGGHGAPYTEADFASVSGADNLPKQVEKALLVIDKAPRG